MQRNTKSVSNVDWVMAAASLLFFIGSFLPLATVTVSLGLGTSVSGSVDSWHSYGIAGILIGLAGIALWVVLRMGLAALPAGYNWPLIAGGAILLGTVLVFIRGIVYAGESASIDGQVVGSASLGYGAFIVLIFGLIAAACAAMRERVDVLTTRAVASARTASQNAQASRAARQSEAARTADASPATDGPTQAGAAGRNQADVHGSDQGGVGGADQAGERVQPPPPSDAGG